jgi:predicted adenine nucleotide alpha hydrolase (AANH) superfamily ATPase
MSARNILIHTCCAPCLIAPLKKIMGVEQLAKAADPSEQQISSQQDQHPALPSDSQLWNPTLLWFNPNIHPYTEYLKRRDTLKTFVEKTNLPIIWQDEYDLDLFLNSTSDFADVRCTKCYELRLTRAAQTAMGRGFDAFTTTLLYSKYQRHDEIKDIGLRLANQFGLEFYYEDWRELWQEGIDLSNEADMYRQPYCGCIFSEKERYWKPSKVIK